MKKITFLLVIILLFVFKTHPQSLVKQSLFNKEVNILEKSIKSKDEYLNIDVVIPSLFYENKEGSFLNKNIEDFTNDWIKNVKLDIEYLFENNIPLMHPYELKTVYEVTNKDKVTSLFIDYYQYTGGAHGATNRKAYTVSNKSDKLLSISDLFKKDYDYKSVIDKEIYKIVALEPEKYFSGKEGFVGINENTKFYIKNNDLVIYFGQYEIGPYASGILEFNISKEIFKDNYILE